MSLLNQTTHRMLLRYHERIGHIFVPNQKARLANEEKGFYVVTNSQGFRSDFEFLKDRGSKPRILMFGDSYTAGDNVSNSERYSDMLASMLDVEVYNYGIPGTGTDQHLLAYREFARDVEADLVVICVQVDSIKRVQARQRKSLDRVSGRSVLVPKPYFELGADGSLELRNVPVPLTRPAAEGDTTGSDGGAGLGERLVSWYRRSENLSWARGLFREKHPELQSWLYRVSGMQPYPEYLDNTSRGWRLLEGVLKEFVREVSPKPVLIVPIPTYEFFLHGARPAYQKLLEGLEDGKAGVFVADATTPLLSRPWNERYGFIYKIGGHFKPAANRVVAETMASKIRNCPRLEKILKGKSASSGGLADKSVNNPAAAGYPRKSADDKYILGISCFYHNSAAALICNGEIVAAAEEERFTRLKNDRRFPVNALNYCLEEAGIDTCHLDALVYYDSSSMTFERIVHSLAAAGTNAEKMWMRMLPSWTLYKMRIPEVIREYTGYSGLILQSIHHRTHAASAFFPSPFKHAAILTVDGAGEWATACIARGDSEGIKLIKEMDFPNSLGLLYSAFTEFTGFKVNSGEYKMMGLAPYGRPVYKNLILDKLVSLKDDGSLELNLEYFGFIDDMKMTNESFASLFGGPARTPDSRITRREMDIARSVQEVVEEAILRMAATAHRLTGEKNLCLAGGVALNCVANGRLLREGPFQKIWIQPAAGDSGCALGAALDAWHGYFGNCRHIRPDGLPGQMDSCWGPSFSEDEIRAYLETHGYPYMRMGAPESTEFLASAISEGKIAGRLAGRMEYGPRALGNRSIIGDPRNPDTQVEMNLKIKYRESFRPFAPSVTEENSADYFELDSESPYMLLVAPVKNERRLPFDLPENIEDMLPVVKQARSDIPAITHVDYSARVQTVNKKLSPEYHLLIKKFKDKTGCPVIVNTSFNVRGEPIVCTPADAYRCFMRTEMNILALGNFILIKEDQPEWPEGKCLPGNEDAERNDAEELPVHDPALLRDLRRIYKDHFLPLASELTRDNSCEIRRAFSQRDTAWNDFPLHLGEKESYEYAPELLNSASASTEEFAKTFAKGFRHSPTLQNSSTPELQNFLKLLSQLAKLGRRYNHIKFENADKVPESVYAMF